MKVRSKRAWTRRRRGEPSARCGTSACVFYLSNSPKAGTTVLLQGSNLSIAGGVFNVNSGFCGKLSHLAHAKFIQSDDQYRFAVELRRSCGVGGGVSRGARATFRSRDAAGTANA